MSLLSALRGDTPSSDAPLGKVDPADAPQGEGDPGDPPPADSSLRIWMRRVAPFVLIGGLLVATAPLVPRIPKERDVELRLEDATTVIGLDLAWIDAQPGDAQGQGEEALQASSWRFAPGAAPRSIHTTVRLPDGAYGVEITVARPQGSDSIRRSITLDDAERITLPIR